MTGTTLAQALVMLKAEIDASLTSGTANDALYRQLIETKQEWFASMYDWDQLADEWDFTVGAGAGGRYPTIPTVDTGGKTISVNFSRPYTVYVMYSLKWQALGYGIGVMEYNVWNPDIGQAQDPVQKFRFRTGDNTKFEIWPLGTVSQTCRIQGQRMLNTLRTNGTLDQTKTLDLDDRLVVLSVALDWLTARDDKSASAKAETLKALWQTLRGAENKRYSSFSLGRPVDSSYSKVVPIKVTTTA